MKDKFLIAIGLARLILDKDYVAKSYRRQFKRLGREILNDMRNYISFRSQ